MHRRGDSHIERCAVRAKRQVDWLKKAGFPAEYRPPRTGTIFRVQRRRTHRLIPPRNALLYYFRRTQRPTMRLKPQAAFGVLYVIFAEDQARLRKTDCAKDMAIFRNIATNPSRDALELPRFGGRLGA